MTYEEFKRELYRNLQQGMPRGRQVLLLEKGVVYARKETLTIMKLIHLSEHGGEDVVIREDIICVVGRRKGVVNLLHWGIRQLYERFKKEGWQSVLPEIIAKMQSMGKESSGCSEDSPAFLSDRLIVRALAYSYQREVLEKSIFWQFGDIALTLCWLFEEEEGAAINVNRDMVAKWDVTEEMLMTNALLNTSVKLPPRLYCATNIKSQYHNEGGVFMPGEGKPIVLPTHSETDGLQGYLLTTAQGGHGAVALFYPGVKERLAELLGGDYYVGFVGVHEVILQPAKQKVLYELKKYLFQNNILNEPRDILTDRVYRYSCSRKELIEV